MTAGDARARRRSPSAPPKRALTSRGASTKARIVAAAADLIDVHGVAATSIDDVIAASATSKSQLYHYFADKDDLLGAVIAHQAALVLSAQEPHLQHLDSLTGLERWRDAIIDGQQQRIGLGCPVGSLVGELAGHTEDTRQLLAAAFRRWESYLAQGLERMRSGGELRADADPSALAVAIMAALQGGLLLSRTTCSTTPLEHSLDMALEHVTRRRS